LKKVFIRIMFIALIFYIVVCALLYFFQESLIFFPQKLGEDYLFRFDNQFEEMNFKSGDGEMLNGVLFKSDSARGLIFYLHGNAGSIDSWGHVAKTYTDLNYDVFMPDYRGYGKSGGSINGEQQILEDNQMIYDELKKKYNENRIIVLGYSIGTGPAANLACANKPRLLILQAPYYSMTDMMRTTYPIIPTFILKYKFATHTYLEDCKIPVVIFHGDQDEVIYYGSSLKLKEQFNDKVTLITLKGQGHNGMTENAEYRQDLRKILTR
jgi:uncharacterized protein